MIDPFLSIVVLQWNRVDLTEQCLTSIRSNSSGQIEVIIVDNGSDKAAAQWAEDSADTAILLDTNLGFAAGMNAGLNSARGTTVAFVSNDTTVPPAWDEMLIATSHPENVGIVAPAISAGGNASSIRSAAGDGIRVARPFIDLPSGVIYVMNTALIRSIGGWREDYTVASSEDLDLLFTTWIIDRDVVIDDRVFVQHVGRATADTQLTNRAQIWRRNRLRFSETWSSMDESRFRSRYGWSGTVVPERLEQARTAAYWMRRYFEADDRSVQLRWDHSKELQQSVVQTDQERNSWWGLLTGRTK